MTQKSWKRKSVRRFRDRRGTEVLEAAFLFLPLMWLTFGAIDFGMYYNTQHNVQGAVREAGRAGCVESGTNANMQAASNALLSAAGFPTPPVIGNCEGVIPGRSFEIKIEMPYAALGVPPARVPTNKVTCKITMIKEGKEPS